jgi:succinate dehydrogenase / fumarate reductase membrane anchor subunit
MAATDYGSHRLVVGAHYGMRDWLAQRVTAVVMALYTLFMLVVVLWPGQLDYARWQALFANQATKLFTLVALLALLYHVWVGVRDIWMDYVKPVGLRLSLQVLTIVWLLACVGGAVQVLWRV